ncbi:MAG: NF038143 family protein [Dehalococcoidales bacterium]
MQTKYGIILSYEESFAKAVAMGVMVRKPLTIWHFLMPFVFVFDFLRMRRETEIFARNFLFTRKLALDAAVAISKGEDRQSQLAEIESKTKDRLVSQKLYSWRTHQGQMAEVNLLLDHYAKLLKAEGDSYPSLVKNAYKTQQHFATFLQQLTSAEREIDRAVIGTLGEAEEVWQSMSMKQTIIDEMRRKGLSKLFSEAR